MHQDRTNRSTLENSAAGRLLSIPRFGDGIGLHRLLSLSRQLVSGEWLAQLDAIRVAGSKGKGSVSALIAEMLRQLDIKTGLYTSPHLMRFHERIRIDSAEISEEELSTSVGHVFCLRQCYEEEHPQDRFGAFEIFTAVAIHHFGRHAVSAVVAEAGIGGRYDSTRILPGRVVALTSVELEHTELLGNSVEEIAYNKADLCPPGGTLVVGDLDGKLLRRLRAYCQLRSVDLIEVMKVAAVSDIQYDTWPLMRFYLVCDGRDFGELLTPLLGTHQAINTAVAVTAVRRWLDVNRPDLLQTEFREAVRLAVRNVQWTGRLQHISLDPEIIIDVGHTPQSLRAVCKTIQDANRQRPVLLVTGVSKDKNITGVLREIVPVAKEVICTRAYHKGAPVSLIASTCEAIRQGIVTGQASTIEEAIDMAVERARSTGMTILIAGGLFLAIEAMVHFRGENPQQLRFF